MEVITRHPELADSICGYFEKYKRIPLKLARKINEYICGAELYHSVYGALLRACLGRFATGEAATLGKFCADRLIRPRRGSIPAQPNYKESMIAWGLATKTLSFAEYDNLIVKERDWWVKKCAIRQLNEALFGPASYADLINRLLRAKEGEVSRIAASRLLQDRIKLVTPYGDVEGAAKRTLKAAGVIKSVGQPGSRINEILAYILDRIRTTYDWKKFFGKNHRHAELIMIFLKKNRETNIDAFLLQLDSYCDFLIAEIYKRLKPAKIYPKYGHALKDATLGAALPNMMAVLLKLHNLRLQSTTAHPRGLRSGKPNRRLKHRDFYNIRPDLAKAFDEFERTIAP
jgi:hypothetical protein